MSYYSVLILLFVVKGQAVAQLAKTVNNVTLIGTASKHKHEAIKSSVDHILDHSNDYVQEIKK
jgi:NADPH:quinone reductase-like Zn-dependent oxidoreductase